MPIKIF